MYYNMCIYTRVATSLNKTSKRGERSKSLEGNIGINNMEHIVQETR